VPLVLRRVDARATLVVELSKLLEQHCDGNYALYIPDFRWYPIRDGPAKLN